MKKVIKSMVVTSLLVSPFYGVSQTRINVLQANSYSSSIKRMQNNIGSYDSTIRYSNTNIFSIN